MPPGNCYKVLFGDTNGAGFIIFHDAWITPDSLGGNTKGLVLDVMTPHHPAYPRDSAKRRRKN